jgi:hypothetical protein
MAERTAVDFPDDLQQLVPVQSQHLLKVAQSVTRDASKVWAQLWAEFKPHVTSSGAVLPSMERGFVPACGWAEFLEQFWLLKHYLDSAERICAGKH